MIHSPLILSLTTVECPDPNTCTHSPLLGNVDPHIGVHPFWHSPVEIKCQVKPAGEVVVIRH